MDFRKRFLIHLLGVVVLTATVDVVVIVPGISLSKALTVLFLCALALYMLQPDVYRSQLVVTPRAVKLSLILAAFLTYSALRLHPVGGLAVFSTYINLAVFAAVLALFPDSVRQISILVRYVVVGVCLLALLAPVYKLGAYRAAPLGMNPNLAGITFTFGVALLGYTYTTVRTKGGEYLTVALAITSIVGLILTESREALIGFAALVFAWVFWIALFERGVGRGYVKQLGLYTGSGVAVVGIAGFLVAPALIVEYIERFASPIKFLLFGPGSVEWSNARTLQERYQILQVGVDLFLENPLFGKGMGTFHSYAASHPLLMEPKGAHNTYVYILSQLGFVGITLFGAFVAILLIQCHRTIALSSGLARRRIMSLSVAIVGGLAIGIGTDILRVKLFWIITGLAIASIRIQSIEYTNQTRANS